MNKILLIIFMSLYGISYAQEYKSDTIFFNDVYVIIKHDKKFIRKDFPYEEGLIKTLHFQNGNIVISSGSMVKIPFTDKSDIEVISEFNLFNEVKIIRGKKDSKYFREDTFFKHGMTFLYQNVSEEDISSFESIFNNLIIDKETLILLYFCIC